MLQYEEHISKIYVNIHILTTHQMSTELISSLLTFSHEYGLGNDPIYKIANTSKLR